MNSSIHLTTQERKQLLACYRDHPSRIVRLRAHIVLLLDQGLSYRAIEAVLFCSSRTIANSKHRFAPQRVEGLLGASARSVPAESPWWLGLVLTWITTETPRAFGFLRSRWCCEVVVILLAEWFTLEVSRETIRRHLHAAGLVWRRPRPVLRRQDPDREAILTRLRALLQHLPDDETAVFEDEADLQLNPKIGSMWMPEGVQAEVVTPGDNDKRYLAGSLHWRTGRLITTQGPKRDGRLFVEHLHEVRRRLRSFRKIHVICDNAKFHAECWEVWEFCHQYGEHVELHFLPKYAPELNPIERIWWRLHEAITRNHQCARIETLVDLAFQWLTQRRSYQVQDRVYLQIPTEPESAAMAA
jgi:transposase